MKRKIGFTLAELLIVVIVIAVLAGVAVPKFSTVLESRKTAEADQMLSAVRLEQEKRCMLKGRYLSEAEKAKLDVLSSAKNSQHYNYTLGYAGAEAASKSDKKSYTLKMLSYRDGRVCCEGDCAGLTYDSCNTLLTKLSTAPDECEVPHGEDIAEDEPEPDPKPDPEPEPEPDPDPCEATPDSCDCADFAAAQLHRCFEEEACLGGSYPEDNCCYCDEGEYWFDSAQKCCGADEGDSDCYGRQEYWAWDPTGHTRSYSADECYNSISSPDAECSTNEHNQTTWWCEPGEPGRCECLELQCIHAGAYTTTPLFPTTHKGYCGSNSNYTLD